MSQTDAGLRAALRLPLIYSSFQKAVGAGNTWRVLVEEYLKCAAQERVLDVGCGAGDVCEILPRHVDYVGVDISEPYIEHAKQRFGDRASFFAADVGRLNQLNLPAFDTAFAVGLLHHLDDDQVSALLTHIKRLLKPQGRVILVEPCWHNGQGAIERMLMKRDRGQNIRTREAYERLCRDAFAAVRSELREDVMRIPWSLLFVTISNNVERASSMS